MIHPPSATILIVEDEFMIRLMLAETLVEQGFAVLEAGNGSEAMEQLRQHPAIGLLLTDLTLPGAMDGIALAQWARRLRPDLPVIYVTGRPDSIKSESLSARDAVVAKPYLPSEIATVITQLLA